MLTGLVTPTSGTARVGGYDIGKQRSQAVQRIGAVLEGSRNVYWSLSAWQNLLYFGWSRSAAAREAEARVIPIGRTSTIALRGYLALRQHHPLADSDDLWLGERGARFGYDGLGRALRRSAHRAGIQGLHPHKLRHTAAHRWLAHGGSESGLIAIAGWTCTGMLVRYTRAHAAERAAQEARRLNLGEL